ncbi:restriction endonuclease [Psychrobacter sp. P2G3]|nr:restriction endonuclease [Psychrobacter sp. P2G3]
MNLAEKLKKFTSSWVQATNESFTNHPTANFLRNDLKEEIAAIVKDFDNNYLIKASVGAGNWANIPWLAILNPKITTAIQDGIYPVYLFSTDGLGFYLSLNQGTTTPKEELGKVKADIRAELIKKYILEKFPELKDWGEQRIDLNANTPLGKSYETANIVAKYYSLDIELDSESLKQDLRKLLFYYRKIETLDIEVELQKFTMNKPEERTKPLQKKQKSLPDDVTPLSKPFLLLAGISGTGKTRFVREQAKATGSLSDTYCLTSVRPDWHEPSDILGYISRLGGDGNAEYIITDVLQFIAKSWRAIIDAGLKLSVSDSNGLDTRLTVTGDKAQLDGVLPYWLCLDEMNLAPVEQYFADYLSVLETRVWQWDAEQFDYCCDPLLKSATIKQLADTNKLRSDLGFIDSKYDREWELFCEHGLSLPFNLIVAGTVNMDETTHGFSRKVIDRALSFDFGEFFPNDFEHFFEPKVTYNILSYPLYSQATIDDLPTIDSTGNRSISFLQSINSVLDNTPFQLAFRALNELLLAVISTQPTDDRQLQAVWDDFLMHKVLPRIEGDHDKLTIHNSTTNNDSLFDELSLVLARELADIWHEPKDSPNARPDLYREKLVAEEDDKVLRITCRSGAKLAWMKGRLERSGFTSFWP